MDDLISRQAAIDVLHGYFDGALETDTICPKDIYNLFEIIPSAEPERKKGHWEPVTNGRGGHQCDRCGCYAPSYQSGTEWLSDFCPMCGADMREEERDE